MKWKKNNKRFPESVKLFLFQNLLSDEHTQIYKVYTEIKLDKKRDRANPNYRGAPWYDWCIVRYELSEADHDRNKYNNLHGIEPAYPAGYYPAKILAFIQLENTIKLVIHCTATKMDSEFDSCLTERFYLEYI